MVLMTWPEQKNKNDKHHEQQQRTHKHHGHACPGATGRKLRGMIASLTGSTTGCF
jgi:hypothetical protein